MVLAVLRNTKVAYINARRKPPEEEGKGTDGEKGRPGVTALTRATPGDIEVRVGGALDPRVMPRDAGFSLQRVCVIFYL